MNPKSKSLTLAALLVLFFFEEKARANPVQIELISPKNCSQSEGFLGPCSFPPLQVNSIGKVSSIPRRTRIKAVTEGVCHSKLPLLFHIFSNDNLTPTPIKLLQFKEILLKAPNGVAIEKLTIQEPSAWKGYTDLDESCRAHLEIDFNLVDIDSRQEALLLLNKHVAEVKNANATLKATYDLADYQKAAAFLINLNESLYQSLSLPSLIEALSENEKSLLLNLKNQLNSNENLLPQLLLQTQAKLQACNRLIEAAEGLRDWLLETDLAEATPPLSQCTEGELK